MSAPTRLLIVDDSALYRQTINNVLRDAADVAVVGVAADGRDALEKIEALDADLLTLDVQMPDLDGIGVLREINRRRLRPKAIMVSSLTAQGAQVTTDALLEGAFDFILKPTGGDLDANRRNLRDALDEKIGAYRQSLRLPGTRRRRTPRAPDADGAPPGGAVCRAVLMGTSTGGPPALKAVLTKLPAGFPVPVLVVQHMPAQYTASLAKRLDEACALEVAEAADGNEVAPGRVLIAPGGRQTKLVLSNAKVRVRVTDDPQEQGCRPSVDYLFRSAVEVFDGAALGVIMTGMGRDGLQGCQLLKARGGRVFAQHEDGCTVFGMPKAVIYDPAFLVSRVGSLLATPLGDADDVEPLEVTLAGHHYRVNTSSQQVLNLLASTFENAVEKNNELIRANQELTLAKEQLTISNDRLEDVNGKLTRTNDRMTRDLNAAARVQQSLLPTSAPETACADFAWKYKPCDELAGDFLNFFALDERHVAAFVVDVSGHGVASSLLSVTVGRLMTPQASSSSLLVKAGDRPGELRIVSPLEVARELNRRFPMSDQNGLYFTIVYGILNVETLEFRYVLAGHPQVVHAPKDGAPKLLDATGMAIGWVPELDCDEQSVQLEPGDRLWLYSDGVPEAMDPDQNQFGSRQLVEFIELSRQQPLESATLLMTTVERWGRDGSLKDDVSIIGLEVAAD